MGYSPRGHKESDMTERLHFHFLSFPDDVEDSAASLPLQKSHSRLAPPPTHTQYHFCTQKLNV